VRARRGTVFTVSTEYPRSSSTAAIGRATFIGSGLSQAAPTASRRERAYATYAPLTPRSSASSRMRSALGSTGRWTGCPKPGTPSAGAARARPPRRSTAAFRASRHEEARALLRGAQDDRSRAEHAGCERALQRAGVSCERHPRGDVRRHHPVLGDGDEEQVEEEPLVLGRLAAREEQVEVLREGDLAHELAGQVASPDLDAVGIRLRDAAPTLRGHRRPLLRAYGTQARAVGTSSHRRVRPGGGPARGPRAPDGSARRRPPVSRHPATRDRGPRARSSCPATRAAARDRDSVA